MRVEARQPPRLSSARILHTGLYDVKVYLFLGMTDHPDFIEMKFILALTFMVAVKYGL